MSTFPPISQKSSTISNDNQLIVKARDHRPTKTLTWKEKIARKQNVLRSQIPFINRVEVAKIRNTYKHNLCVSLLKDGFHKSFAEIYNLIENRKAERLAAGQDSIIWLEKSLEEKPEKLDELAKYLTKAETMERNGKWKDVYENRVRLAEYFLTSGDRWLSDYLFETALNTSKNIKLDGRRREAEAYCNRALALERNGDIVEALDHMRKFHKITDGKPWKNDYDVLLSSISCRHLCRLYFTLADKKSDDIEYQLKCLHDAYQVASESKDESLQKAKCALKLAKKYEENNDSKTALQYLNECLEISQQLGEGKLYARCCQQMAQSLQSVGEVERALILLDMFADAANQVKDNKLIAASAACLGELSITRGEYEKSATQCQSAYKSSEVDAIQRPSVLLGISQAFNIRNSYNMMVQQADTSCDHLISWKNNRNFNSEQQPNSSVSASGIHPNNTPDPTEPFEQTPGSHDDNIQLGGEADNMVTSPIEGENVESGEGDEV